MSGQIKYLHLICTEPRIQKFYHDYLQKNNLFGQFDTIQFPNPILALALADSRLPTLKKVEDIISMHGNTNIVLFDHLDCGAYKQKFRFKDLDEEIKKHNEINDAVRQLLSKSLPNVKVNLKIIKINNDGSCQWYKPD